MLYTAAATVSRWRLMDGDRVLNRGSAVQTPGQFN